MSNDDPEVFIQWLAIGHRPELRWDQQPTQRYFFPQPQPGLFKKLGIPETYAVVPHVLRPRDGFLTLASRGLPGATFTGERRHLPYELELLGLNAEIRSIVSRLYPMGIQSVRVTAHLQLKPSPSYGQLLNGLQALRKPHTVRAADHVIRQALALATGDRTIDASSLSYRTYFGMRISLPVQKDQIPTFVRDHQASIVALLIGSPQPTALSNEIIGSVIGTNRRLNEKSGYEYLLANRGGMVYLTPNQEHRSPHPERFRRSIDIAELALYASTFLEHSGAERQQHGNLIEFLYTKIDSWISSPQVIFSSSVTSLLEWEVLSNAFALAPSLDLWRRTNGVNTAEEEVKRHLFRQAPANWWLLPELPLFLDSLGPSSLAGAVSCICLVGSLNVCRW
jgi:hypothetical protein